MKWYNCVPLSNEAVDSYEKVCHQNERDNGLRRVENLAFSMEQYLFAC